MPLFNEDPTASDPSTGIPIDQASNLGYAIDNAQIASANQTSVVDSIGSFLTEGVPVITRSIINSFTNTGIQVANWFGADIEKDDFEQSLAEADSSGDMLKYYQDRKGALDATALAIGSFIPGTIALKALKVAQAGELGLTVARATNIMAAPKSSIIKGAMDEIAQSGGIFNSVRTDMLKAISLGYGEQALQAGAWELATVATMGTNPILAQEDYKDLATNVLTGAVFGGFLGGSIEAVGIAKQFKQMRLTVEADQKLSELATRYGRGNFNAGDRAADLIESVYNIPLTYDAAGKVMSTAEKAKFTVNKNSAILDAKAALAKIAPENDPGVTNDFFDALLKMRESGAASKEDMYSYLGRLARVNRVNEIAGIPDNQYRVIPVAVGDSAADWSQLGILSPTTTADLSKVTRAYRVDPNVEPSVARFTDSYEWEGMKTPQYANKEDAFKKGVDIYIDPKLQVHVNPESEVLTQVPRRGENRILTAAEEETLAKTGQLPTGKDSLLGASVNFNLIDGGVRDSVVPVVGDIAKSSEITLAKDGNSLIVGADNPQVFTNTVESGWNPVTVGTTPGMTPLQANARYVWAAMRGVKNGDVIQYNDLPMLEQLQRELSTESRLNWRGDLVKIMDQDGVVTPVIGEADLQAASKGALQGTLANINDMILQQKRALVAELSKPVNGVQPVLAETAQKVNAPVDWITNGMPNDIEKAVIDPAQHTRLNNVRLSYDIAGAPGKDADGNVVRGMLDTQYRIRLAKDQAINAFANFAGADYEKYIITKGASEANQLGAGPGFVSFANADAKSLAADTQFVGQQTTLKIQADQRAASEALNSVYHAVQENEAAGAELGVVTHVLRRTPNRYAFLPPEIAAKYNMQKLGDNLIVLERSLVKDAQGNVTDWKPDFTVTGTAKGFAPEASDKANLYAGYVLKNQETADFLRAHQALNDVRLVHHNNWLAAQGIYNEIQPGSLYVPPIDTSKYKFVAFVRDKQGSGMGSSSVSAIAAEDAASLQAKVGNLGDRYEVFYKSDIKKNHQVIGDYDYNMNLVQNNVDDTLKRQGILSDIAPTTRGENVLQEYTNWHMRQITRLNRNYVELANGQLFAELRALGQRYTGSETSKVGYVASAFTSSSPNPYNSYINTALGISEKSTYRLWQDANEKLEQYFSTAFKAARETFGAASKGLLPYEEATKITASYGLGNPYAATADALRQYGLVNKLPPQNYLQGLVAQAHSIISATAIRLDAFQNLINIVSTPVMLMSQASAVKNAALKELTSVTVPGTSIQFPSAMKAVYGALNDYFHTETRQAVMPIYKQMGWVRDRASDYIEMLNDVSLAFSGAKMDAIQQGMKNATDKAATLLGSNAAEEMVRFIAARTGQKLYEAQGMQGNDLWSAVNTFVNRVHGNYIASQRPIAFQGPLGQAIGLFQTYQLNLMQQVFKHIENGEGKSLAIIAGLQSTLFGLQGLPGFAAINNHIVGNAAGNTSHTDFYSGIQTLAGNKDVGNWLLYGSVSNVLGAGLYTRGDINPRQVTILPVNPLDYPAVSGTIRFVQSLANTFSKIKDGGNIMTSILNGLEHNGLSRPLTGLAQTMQGYATTGQGKLIAASNDWASIATASRIAGARPLDEAIAMDAAYRITAYQANDTEKLKQLGEAVRTTMYNGQQPTEDQVNNFASEYAAKGGYIRNFGKFAMDMMQTSNIPAANALSAHLGTWKGQYEQKVMGGVPLPTFTAPSVSSGSSQAGSTLPAGTE